MNTPMGEKPWIFRSREGYEQVLEWYERELEATEVPVESRWLETAYGKTHLLVAGPEDAPPLVLLHGLSINAMGVRRFWRHLQRDFRVYAPDIIGQPGRSSAHRPGRAGQGYPRWLVEVMDAQGLDEAAVMGVSFGSWVTLKLASYAPERIRKGVLFVPAGIAPVRLRAQLHFARRVPPYLLSPNEERLRRIVDPLFSPGATPEPALLDLMRIAFHQFKAEAAPYRPFFREELPGYQAPTLVIAGERDLFYRADELLQRARRLLPRGSVCESIPEGHVFFDPAMERVCGRIAAFLKD